MLHKPYLTIEICQQIRMAGLAIDYTRLVRRRNRDFVVDSLEEVYR